MTEDDVRLVWDRSEQGFSIQSTTDLLEVDRVVVSGILTGRRWKHVQRKAAVG